MMLTSDDQIRVHADIDIPAGVKIECEEMDNGHHLLSIGGMMFSGPRLIIDLWPGAADQLVTAVRSARTR